MRSGGGWRCAWWGLALLLAGCTSIFEKVGRGGTEGALAAVRDARVPALEEARAAKGLADLTARATDGVLTAIRGQTPQLQREVLELLRAVATDPVLREALRSSAVTLVDAISDDVGARLGGAVDRRLDRQLDRLEGELARIRPADQIAQDIAAGATRGALLEAKRGLAETDLTPLGRQLGSGVTAGIRDELRRGGPPINIATLSTSLGEGVTRGVMAALDGTRLSRTAELGLVVGGVVALVVILGLGAAAFLLFRRLGQAEQAMAVIAREINEETARTGDPRIKQAVKQRAVESQVQPWLANFLQKRNL